MSSRSRTGAIVVGVAVSALLLAAPVKRSTASVPPARIAVFPVENLSGGTIPAGAIRAFLINRLVSDGVQVLETGALDEFFERHRVRYTAGIDVETAAALRAETKVQGVIVASVEQFNNTVPPRLALFARLVSIEGLPTVTWADDVALAGDEAPGLLDLGIVTDYDALQGRALGRIGDSLIAFVKNGARPIAKAASKFRPRGVYRAGALEKGKPFSIAVIPFFNLTDRRNAGDILGLLFVRHLSANPEFQVIDTGVVRRQLLDARIIMDGGLSLSDADMVASLVDADLVLGGRVLRYEGSSGSAGAVRVEFSTVVIEKKTRKVVWSSDSTHDGAADTGLFERGALKTAHRMATQMVQLTAASIAGRER